MKYKIKIFYLLLICIFAFTCTACASGVKNINDFYNYKTLTKDNTDKIEVNFDNYTGKTFHFDITDPEEIAEIMDIIFTEKFIKMDKGFFAGGNTYIVIIQGSKSYNVNVSINKNGLNFYKFESNDLQAKIIELARKAGAFNYEENYV